MKRITTSLVPAAILVALGVAPDDAHSGNNAPGIAFKASFAANAGCLSIHTGFGNVRNNCTHAVDVVAALTVPSEAWYPTKISLFGSNSWCRSITVNPVGNGVQVGPQVWTTAGPQTWQTLNLGDRFVWSWASLAFRCSLEPGGVIGQFGNTI